MKFIKFKVENKSSFQPRDTPGVTPVGPQQGLYQVDGKTYASRDEMPEDVRKKFDEMAEKPQFTVKGRHVPFSVGVSVHASDTDPKVKARANVLANIIVLLVLLGMAAIYLLFKN